MSSSAQRDVMLNDLLKEGELLTVLGTLAYAPEGVQAILDDDVKDGRYSVDTHLLYRGTHLSSLLLLLSTSLSLSVSLSRGVCVQLSLGIRRCSRPCFLFLPPNGLNTSTTKRMPRRSREVKLAPLQPLSVCVSCACV
jgi:hypothetical protein